MEHAPIPDLAVRVATVVRAVMAEIRPRLLQAALTGQRGESRNLRHRDNFLSSHDLWMHDRYRELLGAAIGSFVYASEEADPVVVGPEESPDLCVLVDPLDTSELAVRALHGYTHVLVYSRSLARPVVAVVGDIFHHVQSYVAALGGDGLDRAWLETRDGSLFLLDVSSRTPVDISSALVTNYLMRPEQRFTPLTRQQALLQQLGQKDSDGKSRGRIGVDFGSVSLCHVASGATDATVEFAKGFALWDLAPGHYVLSAAGGAVIDLGGKPLSLTWPVDSLADLTRLMRGRQTFVAAASQSLAEQIAATLVV